MYVDIVPTVGDFGFDLIASFKVGTNGNMQKVIVSLTHGATMKEWTAANFTLGDEAYRKLRIRCNELFDELGRRGLAKTLSVCACTESVQGVRSEVQEVQVDLTKTYTANTRISGESL